jgi:3-deoxy-D-manno-octulosonic-acid transferase
VRHSLAALSAAAAAPVVLGGLLLRPRWRAGLPERLGRAPEGAAPGAVWVHGASVGEIRAAVGLLDALASRGLAVVASTTTTTGRDLMRRLRPGLPCTLAPLDHPWCVERSLARVAPRALVLVETELWPIWIAAAARRGVPVAIVSGRISERSFPRYRRAAPLLRATLRRIARVGARSERDAERFAALGIPAERLEVTGDLKLEPALDCELAADLERLLADVPLLVAGSTHDGEERAALSVLEAAERAGLPLALAVAPRYPARAGTVAAECARAGRRLRLRSAPGAGRLAPGEVLLLDTLGELPALYGRAGVAFVGGSLARVGGHNLLEPLQRGCPVVFGPHVANAAEAAALALGTGAGYQVDDEAGLRERVLDLLGDPEKARRRAAAARTALEGHRGATQRTLRMLARVIEGLGDAPPSPP